MSRQGSNGGSRRTTEAAPPRLIRVERQSTMERKLPTIKEDECTNGDQAVRPFDETLARVVKLAHSHLGLFLALQFLDSGLFITSSTWLLQHIISSLHAEFAMTDLGPVNYFLGISVTRTTSDTKKKLGPEGSPATDPTLYCSLAGALQYLTFTRLDLSYAVQQLCLYMHDPREPHLNDMKHVLRCPATRRSTSGYCVFLGDNLLTWSSKRQDTLSRSSAEAEYRGVANAVTETSWIRNLLRELHTLLFTATLVYCDNVSAVYMSANPVQHQPTKHIEVDIHFVRDKVVAGHVRVLHFPSRFQYVDIFTKGLPYPLFTDFRSSLSVRKSPASTAGAY
ncbi:ribonuclease H-like domain-containing protein [Tanacetum coccineum]